MANYCFRDFCNDSETMWCAVRAFDCKLYILIFTKLQRNVQPLENKLKFVQSAFVSCGYLHEGVCLEFVNLAK